MIQKNTLSYIRIVMIHTSHPGNIGAAARAMKTMGLAELVLVSPKHFPDEQATAMASGADDLLQACTVVDTFEAAIADCHYVIGTSARSHRTLNWPMMNSRECGEFVTDKINEQHKVALVFGRERTGLTNEELDLCHYLVHIPSNPDYNSLNVASAIQILSYECAFAFNQQIMEKNAATADDPLVDQQALEAFYEHLSKALISIRYLDPDNPRYLLRRLRRLFGRIHMTVTEMNILRGILSSIEGRKFVPREKADNKAISKTENNPQEPS